MLKTAMLVSALAISAPAFAQDSQPTQTAPTTTSPAQPQTTPPATAPQTAPQGAPIAGAPTTAAQAAPAPAAPADPAAAQPAEAAQAAPQTAPAQPAAEPAQTAAAPGTVEPAVTPAAAGASQVAQVVSTEFPTYDKNGDKSLDKTEFGAWMVALKTASDPSTKAGDPATTKWVNGAFASADTDKSKAVSQEELTKYLSQGQSAD